MTDEELEKMGFKYVVNPPQLLEGGDVIGWTFPGNIVPADRLKAGVKGARDAIKVMEVLRNPQRGPEPYETVIKNLKTFLGEK